MQERLTLGELKQLLKSPHMKNKGVVFAVKTEALPGYTIGHEIVGITSTKDSVGIWLNGYQNTEGMRNDQN